MSRGAYILRFDRPLAREVVRLVRSQTNRARRELKAPTDKGVHAARKALKRARAALRLVRGVLPRERYRRFDHDLRDLGRRLAPVRDAAVALELVDALEKDAALAEPTTARLRAWLSTAHADAWQALDAAAVATMRAQLDALRLVPEELDSLDAVAFHEGLAWTYDRGLQRLARVVKSPSTETFHAWRRQVKHLGYQLRLIASAWPLVLRPTARALDALAEALGDEHDLAELYRAATLAGLDPTAIRALERRTRRRREAIYETVWPLGARIYAESRDAFAGRMAAYLTAAMAEAQGVSHRSPGETQPPFTSQRFLVEVTG